MPNLTHVEPISVDGQPLATHLVQRHTGYADKAGLAYEERLQ